MDLALIRHLWGISEPWEVAFPKIGADGYQGIEYLLPSTGDTSHWQDLLQAHDLSFLPIFLTRGETVDDHIASFEEQVTRALPLSPMRANCHAGRDLWSREESRRFFSAALDIVADLPFDVGFETHRGRIFFNPWVTRDLLLEYTDLQLTCDLSHWVTVCERLLDSEQAIIEQCAERCVHIHARVGYEEGPQVPDPRAPEYSRHLDAHESWWCTVWRAQVARGMSISTLTPEYGPPPYQQRLPYTGVPVANVAEISTWMAKRQMERFEHWKGQGLCP
jgi:hypothetical protein